MRTSFICLLLFSLQVTAQISIYDCNSYPSLQQGDLESAGGELYRPCVQLGPGGAFFNYGSDALLIQGSEIRINPSSGFTHFGPHNVGGYTHLQSLEKSDFDVAVMNYTNFTSILKYEKLEVGITLPVEIQNKVTNFLEENAVPMEEKINPFLEWELRIVAEFKDLSTGIISPIDAFYFRNMQHDVPNDTWVDAGTLYPFRARFAPSKVGNWDCTVKIYINEQLQDQSLPFKFKVINSNNPGFVQIHSNGKNLARGENNQIFYPIGTNLPVPASLKAGDVSYSSGHPNTGGLNGGPAFKLHYWTDFLDNISKYADRGGQYFRFINSADYSDVEFEHLGNYYDRLFFANEVDDLLDLAHDRNLLIHFNMMLHTPIMVAGDYSHVTFDYTNFWPQEFVDLGYVDYGVPYCYSTEFNSSLPSDMVLNDEAFKFVKQRYRYLISRYGYSTNVELFELLSEPWHMNEYENNDADRTHFSPAEKSAGPDGDIARQAITKFHTGLADYIKNHLQRKEHLIASMGKMPVFRPFLLENDGNLFNINETSWSSPNIDLASISTYSASPNKLINFKMNYNFQNDNIGFEDDSGSENNEEKSYAYSIHKIYEAYGKPTLIAETGMGDNLSKCSGFKMHAFDVMKLGFTGLAGFNMWEGFQYSDRDDTLDFDQSSLWNVVIRAKNHFNAPQDALYILQGNWTQGREVQKGNIEDNQREQQYFISEDRTKCIGYVANRTYNPFTLKLQGDTYSKCYELSDGITSEDNVEITSEYNNLVTLNSCFGNALTCEKFEIQGLKPNTDYFIDWYSYEFGVYTNQSECFNTTSNGVWRMNHPTLTTSAPILWYVIYQNNCNSGISQANEEIEETNPSLRVISAEKEPIDETFLTISPNPFNDEIHIQSSENISELTITDNLGRILIQNKSNGNDFFFDLSRLSSGIYYIEVNGNGTMYSLVKQ